MRSNYDVVKWHKERKNTEKVVENKCRYSYVFKTENQLSDSKSRDSLLPVIDSHLKNDEELGC